MYNARMGEFMNYKEFFDNNQYRDQALTLRGYTILKNSLRSLLAINLLLFLFGLKTMPYYYPGELTIESIYSNIFDVQNPFLKVGLELALILSWIILIYSILRVIVVKIRGWKLIDRCSLLFMILDMVLVLFKVRPTQKLDFFELWNPVFAFFFDLIFSLLFFCVLHNTGNKGDGSMC